jgi:hypothetical protein
MTFSTRITVRFGDCDPAGLVYYPAPSTYGFGFLFDGLKQASVNAPATKEQCKGDGRQSFAFPRAFKNQGDYIQYFNTGK